MAKTKYDSKWDQTTGDLYTAALHDAEQDGIQQEFEERTKATAPSLQTLGTVSLAIDGPNDKVDVTVAASSALFVAGLRYETLASMTFVAQATGTYRLYVNNTTETTGSIISTDALPANCVQIGTVAWDLPSTTLSSLVSWIPTGVTTLGDILYGGSGGSETRLAGHTAASQKFLAQTGTGTVSAAPSWQPLSVGDIPAHASTHQNGGADEISVAGLSGLLADAQTPASHVHAGEDITSGTVAAARIAAAVRTIFVHAFGMWPSTTAGCAALAKTEIGVNLVNVQTLDFDQTTRENAEFQLVMPDGWNAGTITYKAIWTAAAGAGGVAWQLEATALANDDAIDTAWGTAVVVTDTLLATDDLHDTGESGALTVGNSPAAGEYVQFRVSRDPANGGDTLTADAKLLGIRIEYTGAYTN